MNTDQVEGKFEQLKGEIKKTWAKLTDDEIMLYDSNKDQFFGKLQERYGLAKEAAEKQMETLQKACPACMGGDKPTKAA